jgi:hypothetical protein
MHHITGRDIINFRHNFRGGKNWEERDYITLTSAFSWSIERLHLRCPAYQSRSLDLDLLITYLRYTHIYTYPLLWF